MYAIAKDETAGTTLGVFSGTEVTDQEYERSLLEMERADRLAAERGIPYIHVLVVDREVPRPSASWRKRFYDANHGVKSERFFFVMVTTSALIRGVFTAVSWVTERREGQQYGVVGTIEDAQEWLKLRGAHPPELTTLEQRARRELSPSPRRQHPPRA